MALAMWVSHLGMNGHNALLERLFPLIVGLILRARPDFGDLLASLTSAIEAVGIHQLIPELQNVLDKL
jgi:hypothetical protein